MWKQPKCPSRDEWINKLWYIHTVEYYSVIKKDGILVHVIAWIILEKILSERSQTQRATYYMIPIL